MTDAPITTTVTTDVTVDADPLARLFRPPAEVLFNEEWTELFHEQVRQLRRDAAGLPLDMAQSQLIERIASTYIRVKWYESAGGMSNTQLLDLNKLYLAYVAQFQKILQSSDEALRQDLLLKSMDICERGVDRFDDLEKTYTGAEVRQILRQHFKTEYAAMGW